MASSPFVTTTAVLVAMLLLWTNPGYGQDVRFPGEQNDVVQQQHQQQQQQPPPQQNKIIVPPPQKHQQQQNQQPTADRFDIGDFNMALFNEVALSTNSSVFMSPYSIWSAFLLTYFGSEGTSEKQLQAALGVSGKQSVYTKWKELENLLQKPGQQNGAVFKSLNKAYFDASINLKRSISVLINNLQHVDFGNQLATGNLINEEVRRTTEGLIPKLIKPEELNSQTLLLLLNAVFFKGKWESKFELKDTKIRDFYGELNNKVLGKVEMMHGKVNKAKLNRNTPLGDADIVAIPYDNSSISMIFIKPTDGATLNSILSKLTYERLEDVLSDMILLPVNMGIPKFRMETEIKGDLIKALNSLGVSDIFSERANLTGFSNTPLKVDKVIHKAVIEVSEEGTKAAAATAVQIVPLSFIPTPEIIMDRPFIYLIHDNSAKLTLFAGTFRHPDHVQSLS